MVEAVARRSLRCSLKTILVTSTVWLNVDVRLLVGYVMVLADVPYTKVYCHSE